MGNGKFAKRGVLSQYSKGPNNRHTATRNINLLCCASPKEDRLLSCEYAKY